MVTLAIVMWVKTRATSNGLPPSGAGQALSQKLDQAIPQRRKQSRNQKKTLISYATARRQSVDTTRPRAQGRGEPANLDFKAGGAIHQTLRVQDRG